MTFKVGEIYKSGSSVGPITFTIVKSDGWQITINWSTDSGTRANVTYRTTIEDLKSYPQIRKLTKLEKALK